MISNHNARKFLVTTLILLFQRTIYDLLVDSNVVIYIPKSCMFNLTDIFLVYNLPFQSATIMYS